MTGQQLTATMRGLVIALLVLMPIIFWRGILEAFDLTKATVLWTLGPILLGAVVLHLLLTGIRTVPKEVMVVAATISLGATVATITSISPIMSLIGQYGRYTGLVGLLLCVVAFIATSLSFESRDVLRLAQILTVAMVPVGVYAAVQVTGNDPFAWGSGAFSVFTMSTLGNPNFGAAFVAMVLPLITLTMTRADAHLVVRVLGGAVFGLAVACLSVFASFQGPVAVLSTVLFLIMLAWWHGWTLGGWTVVVLLSTQILIVPAFDPSGWMMLTSAVLGAALMAVFDRLASVHAPASVQRHRIPIIGAAGLSFAVVVAVGAGRAVRYVQEGWRSGFLERGDFYRAAWTIFKENPITGSGLETYGIRFPEVRPASHAIAREASLSSSAHSVPLGMFANGGVILGVAYLLVVGVVAWVLVRCLRSTPRGERHIIGAVGSAWLAYQIQSLVSVENVTIFVFHFVLAGLIMALANERGLLHVAAKPLQRGPKLRPRTSPIPLVIGVGLVSFLVSAVLMTRPIRAAYSAQTATLAVVQRGDGDAGLRGFTSAIDLAPWEPQYRIRLAELYQGAGLLDAAIAQAQEAAERANGSPVLMATLAELVAKAGNDALSLEYMDEATAHDPFAPNLHERAATRYVEAGANAAASGDKDLARSRFERALELVPDFDPALQALASL